MSDLTPTRDAQAARDKADKPTFEEVLHRLPPVLLLAVLDQATPTTRERELAALRQYFRDAGLRGPTLNDLQAERARREGAGRQANAPRGTQGIARAAKFRK